MVSSFSVGKIFGAYGAGVLADRLGERVVVVGGALIAAVFWVFAPETRARPGAEHTPVRALGPEAGGELP